MKDDVQVLQWKGVLKWKQNDKAVVCDSLVCTVRWH